MHGACSLIISCSAAGDNDRPDTSTSFHEGAGGGREGSEDTNVDLLGPCLTCRQHGRIWLASCTNRGQQEYSCSSNRPLPPRDSEMPRWDTGPA
jgi:hypothetical protein